MKKMKNGTYKNIYNYLLLLGVLNAFAHENAERPTILISVPKCGTFMAAKCIAKLSGKQAKLGLLIGGLPSPNNFLVGHSTYKQDNIDILNRHNYRAVFIYRDPRDQLIASVHWVYLNKGYWPEVEQLDFDTLLLKLINDCAYVYRKYLLEEIKHCNIVTLYNQFLPWQKNAHVYTTTFEKLVGSKGGGDDAAQAMEIKRIAAHLGITISLEGAKKVGESLFGSSITFRAGNIGA